MSLRMSTSFGGETLESPLSLPGTTYIHIRGKRGEVRQPQEHHQSHCGDHGEAQKHQKVEHPIKIKYYYQD